MKCMKFYSLLTIIILTGFFVSTGCKKTDLSVAEQVSEIPESLGKMITSNIEGIKNSKQVINECNDWQKWIC